MPQLICKQCGFVTHDFKDMVMHLAYKQEYKAENCYKKIIDWIDG